MFAYLKKNTLLRLCLLKLDVDVDVALAAMISIAGLRGQWNIIHYLAAVLIGAGAQVLHAD